MRSDSENFEEGDEEHSFGVTEENSIKGCPASKIPLSLDNNKSQGTLLNEKPYEDSQ